MRELALTHAEINAAYFKRALRPVVIELSDAAGRLGRWLPDLRTIEIGRELVLEHPWGVVVEVLKHEMAHQYVHDVLGERSEAAHGPAFRQVCERLGIDPSASGVPAGAPRADEEMRVLERIAKLLALAESSNVHEAEAAMGAAQRLMLKHNLDTVRARLPMGYGFRHLGEPTGRVAEHQRLLAAILGEHFFVEVIWVPVYRPLEQRRGSVLEICGSPANLDMAEYVHSFLASTAERLWREHQRETGVRSNRDRRTYLAGVMTGFLDKLKQQKSAHREEGLVWVRDADLGSYYRKRHPHILHTRLSGNRRTEAHAHGREAGRRIVLHRPVDAAATSGGRLLPR